MSDSTVSDRERLREAVIAGRKTGKRFYVERHTVVVPQPLGSGYGWVTLHYPRSHRTGDKLRALGASSFYPLSLGGRTIECKLPNTTEAIEKAIRLPGVNIYKRNPPVAKFHISYLGIFEWRA